MANYNVVTQNGVLVVHATNPNSRALSGWLRSHYEQMNQQPQRSSLEEVTLPSGRAVAFLVDLREVPEVFECSFYQSNPQALKAGQPPDGFEWLAEKTFPTPPTEGE